MLCLRKDEARLERDLKALSDKPQDREVYMDRMMTIKEEREAVSHNSSRKFRTLTETLAWSTMR